MNLTQVPVGELVLDYSNPRIARVLEMYNRDEIAADAIALALGAGDNQDHGETYTSFRSLKESIRVHKGIIQAIIVNRNVSGELIVIEGNTRVQIFRDFINDGVEGDWTTIPAVVHEDLSQYDIDAIRLQAHLVGPRPWEPYSKARYLDGLRNGQHMTVEQIVELCGGRRKEILDYIDAYRDMETFYRPAIENAGGTFDSKKFSAFVELQKPIVIRALAGSSHNKHDFARWVVEDKFRRLEQVRRLPEILSNERAREAFLSDCVDAAITLLDVPQDDISLADAPLIQLAKAFAKKISSLGLNDFTRLRKSPDGEEYGILMEAKAQLDEMFSLIDGESDA